MSGLLKRPIYTDWIVYLWILSIIAILPGTLFSDKNGGGFGSLLIALVFQSLVFLVLPAIIRNGVNSKKLENEKFQRAPGNEDSSYSGVSTNVNAPISTVSVKICSECENPTDSHEFECAKCGVTAFVHKSVPKEPELVLPEMKTCPMCAEEIKYAAKKCRFCQHIL